MFGFKLKSQFILPFSLFLLLFMSLTALFGTIYSSYYTILFNFYLYLQFFQQKVFSFGKISRSQIDLYKYHSRMYYLMKFGLGWCDITSIFSFISNPLFWNKMVILTISCTATYSFCSSYIIYLKFSQIFFLFLCFPGN